ncbi:phosphate ABC transporter substrate-binding protein [Stutzerimonas stutzeri]|uniref:Phosphate ABC transporter substrate-binding protein n=1 Tax=Stutzerimonas stutzeri TaxID=316 RepID=A0A2N8R9U2_STUST|nr:phosphate ABC transporter substrate-binding protein [Stutzerimonas stutzeri]MCQ4255848.1 phosphate ABC transporter substrate-binding protein [Stutzerimonas stutzeri]PNF57860.1 phosphate ABC transporter substrate-binding protein [Stutzerimonas stutzeri]
MLELRHRPQQLTTPRLRTAIAVALLTITAPALAALSDSEMTARDAENKRLTAELMAKPNELTQPLESKYNHIITYGQSLASAAEGWPALSVAPRYDNLMLGQSPRSAAFSGAAFKPVGEAAFTPLRAVVQQKSNAAVLLDAEKVAKLDPKAQEEGESVEVGALNMARRLYLHHLGRDTDPDHLLVASNASTSGRSVAQLSKSGGTNEYRRVTQAVEQAKALADAQQASYSISAFFWLQGEFDYSHTNGGKNDKDYYKAKLRQLRDDLYADTAKAIAGQEKMPAFFSYQTDAKSSVKDGSLAIGMAQWELAQEEPGWYLVGPVYPYTDKGVHLSANGYRWFGQMLGKVYHRVVIERKDWTPLAPRQATLDGRDVLIDFLVPHPPLAFDQSYIGHQARDVKDKGFVLRDDQGEVPIDAVDIVADTIVRLRAGRDLSGQPRISYASHQVGGAGQLRDSDPMRADATYEYLPDLMPAEANIKALVHQPYPLHNWSIAFDIAAEKGTPTQQPVSE